MVNTKYSPCGRFCEVCEAKKEVLCQGCAETNGKPFHLKEKTCPLWDCAQKHNVEHCGQCAEFPCEKFLNWYNPEHGKKSVLPYVGLLFIRKKFGIEEWKKWARINKEK